MRKEKIVTPRKARTKAPQEPEGASLLKAADLPPFRHGEEPFESEQRLQTVVDHLSEGLVISDLDGKALQWNRAGLEMHGFATAEEGHRHLPAFAELFELVTLEGTLLPVEQWPLRRILRGERLSEVELRIRRRESEWERIFSYGGSIVEYSTGKTLAFVTFTDITERKVAEAALKESEARLRTTLDNLLEGCQILDFNWKYCYANARAGRHGNKPAQELLGRTMMELYPGIEATDVFASLRR
ncbi:MAG: PAS domain S-box protein, partial [Verrucomicrobiota bacterium]